MSWFSSFVRAQVLPFMQDALNKVEHAEVATLLPFAEQFAKDAIAAVAANPTDLKAAGDAIAMAAQNTAKVALQAGVTAGTASLATALSTAIANAHAEATTQASGT